MLIPLTSRFDPFVIKTLVRRPRLAVDVRGGTAAGAFCFLAAMSVFATAALHAQDNPFDVPNGLPGFDQPLDDATDSARTSDSSVNDEAADTVLSLQLKQRARAGDLAAADSISALARIGRWKDVDQLLSDATGRKISDAVLAEMGKRIDPALMIRIRLNETLTDTSRQLIDRMSNIAKLSDESPKRLQSAIVQLESGSRDDQLAGLRILRSGGHSAIAELVHAVIANKPTEGRDDLLRALASFGTDGIEALQQVALYGDHQTDPEIRVRAIDSLVRMTGRGAVLDLITTLAAIDSTDAERNAAGQHLIDLGLTPSDNELPGRDVAAQVVKRDFQRAREMAKSAIFDQQTATLWSLNESRNGVAFQEAPAYLKPYRAAADAAARLRRIGIDSEDTAYDVLGSDIGYRLLVDPDWGDADQIKALRTAYGQDLSATTLAGSIANAMQQRDDVALVGLLRLVSAVAEPSLATPLIHLTSSSPSPLVRAVDHPQPRVRFEAAAAIAKIASPSGYPGSSRVRRTLDEMRSLGDRPTALLLETRPEVIIEQENLLSQLGYQVIVVGSTGSMEKCVASGGDLRLLLAKTGIVDTTAVELVDRLRRIPQGGDLPMLLYGDFAPGLDAERWNAPTLLIDQPVSLAGLSEVIQSMGWHQSLPVLSANDRQRFRQIAVDALAGLPALR